jgi:ankyrin repeat protein
MLEGACHAEERPLVLALIHVAVNMRTEFEGWPFALSAGTAKLHAELAGGRTTLEWACRSQEWKLVRALVNAGVSLNMNAQFQGRLCTQSSVVKMIQITIYVVNKYNLDNIRVALHAACYYGAKEMVYFFLEKGADPNISGQYPLFFQIQSTSPAPHS